MADVNSLRVVQWVTTIFLLFAIITVCHSKRYEPNWDSIDSRPLPSWYDESKIGIFLHWGVFSVPSVNAWLWELWKSGNKDMEKFMTDNYKPNFTYQEFAPEFTAEFFNPEHWADIFNASGAKYVVLTSKHHEGYTNWPSKYSFGWNSMDVGPNKDLVGMLADAIRRKTDIRFGLYHSLFEWFNPIYMEDKKNKYKTNEFVRFKAMPELYELVNQYKPDVVWSDGDWEAPDTYWNSTGFLAWLYNDSPVKDTVVTNDRWGAGIACHHGGYLTCSDRFNPGKLQKRKWENCMTVDKSVWTYRRTATIKDMLTPKELIDTVVTTVSCGGNILINVGPTREGTIIPVFEERLRQMGQWLGVNGDAIYQTKPWTCQNDTITPNVWYTSKKTALGLDVYAISLDWPKTDQLYLDCPSPSPESQVTLLGYPGPLTWSKGPNKGININVPLIPFHLMPCDYAWVFKISNIL